VLPERAGAAVGAVVKTAVDTMRWVGAGVTHWGCLLQRFCLGLCFAARTKDSVMIRLVGSGTDGAQPVLEWAHHGTVAVSPTPRADGGSNPLFSRLDGESDVAEHEATALEALEVMTTLRIVNVKKHCTGVQFVGVSDQARHGPLVQVNGVLPLGGKEDLLNLKWCDGNGLAFGVIGKFGAKVQEVGDAGEGFGQANLHPCLGGIVFMDPLCRSVEVCVHDLDVSFDQQNITHKGKAPKVVPGLSDGLDGSPMRTKI
jgi:hypothetical protein